MEPKPRHPILIAVEFRRRCKKKFAPLTIPEEVRKVALERYGITIKV